MAIGGVPIRRAGELFGIVSIVFFSPEDLNIIKNGPGERRRFLDLILCETDKIYMSDLTRYGKCLAQRNKLLHDLYMNPYLESELSVWDEQLAGIGRRIIDKRAEFILSLSEIASEIHLKLTGEKEKLSLSYEPNTDSDLFLDRLIKNRDTDKKMKTTTSGPHRDDFCIRANAMDLRTYGSQGQQRTAALSLKLSEIRLIEDRIHDHPVLLLDDVLSELDRDRQNYLLQSIKGTQTLITCTGLDEFVENNFVADRTFHVNEGSID
jgi:DNA replication and repair protein RecF